MSANTLTEKHCAPCDGRLPMLSESRIAELADQLHADWQADINTRTLQRTFRFKGFAKATYLANLCAWLADREGHHPDIHFGWGYCTVELTTHDAGGLTENDFIWAAQLDKLVN